MHDFTMILRIQRRMPAPLLLLFSAVLSYCWVSIAADASFSKESVLVPHHHSNSSIINNSDSRTLADFEWDIVRKAGYPIFSFSNATEDEVTFKYSVSGTTHAAYGTVKYFRAGVFTADCTSTANLPAILFAEELTEADEYTVELDILQAYISNSDYYNEISPANATINFCLRLDYVYEPADGSGASVINFHETNVTLSVDLTAGFSLTGIAVDRDAAEAAGAAISLEYPVTAYFCGEDSVEIPPPTLSQGAVMQFCVEINENVTTSDVYVSDILSVDLDQSSGGSAHADIITDTVEDWLTRKTCAAGICNIKTQLTSKWFAEIDPESMEITGTALLAFGTASTRRYLRVAFGAAAKDQDDQLQRQQRKLQDSETITDPLEDLLSKFGLTVDLEGDSVEDDNRLGMIIVCVAASVCAIILCQIVSCCFCRQKVIAKTTSTNIYHERSNAGGQSTPAFYPPPAAFYPPPIMFQNQKSQRSLYAPETQPVASFHSDSDNYDVCDVSRFAIATKVTPVNDEDEVIVLTATDGRQPPRMHGKNRAFASSAKSDNYNVNGFSRFPSATKLTAMDMDDEVIVVAVPVVTKKKHKSRKSSGRHSGSDGLHHKSHKSSSQHGGIDGLHRSDSRKQNSSTSGKHMPETYQYVD
jgi:hypothetical protein